MAPTPDNPPSALIVGGSSGIGLSAAQALYGKGVSVILVGSSEVKLAAAKELLAGGEGGVEVTTWQADLSTTEGWKGVVARIAALDDDGIYVKYLINSAGVFAPKGFLENDEDDYEKYMSLNKATFFITQATAKHMKSHNGGSIVNIGSMWAQQAIKATPSTAYSMAKAGLHALTQHAAMELAPHNIRVNAVSPAVVATPIYEAFIPRGEVEKAMRGLDGMHPIGRVGTAGEVADVVVFLLMEAGWATGAVWDVDGGVMAGRN